MRTNFFFFENLEGFGRMTNLKQKKVETSDD